MLAVTSWERQFFPKRVRESNPAIQFCRLSRSPARPRAKLFTSSSRMEQDSNLLDPLRSPLFSGQLRRSRLRRPSSHSTEGEGVEPPSHITRLFVFETSGLAECPNPPQERLLLHFLFVVLRAAVLAYENPLRSSPFGRLDKIQ